MIPYPSRRAAIAALACLAAMLAGCGHAPPAARDPESAANAFFAALEKGDARTAYDSAAFGFQAAQTFDAFLSNARELGIVGGQPPVWTNKDLGAAEARLDGTVVSQWGAPVNISITLTPDGDEWKLFALHTETGPEPGELENRFTTVGKGNGFNDVYHQPMPGPKQLDGLVHETMSKFNDAIRSNSFHDFYGYVSQQWRDGERMTGERAQQVTEGMLKHHFQDFIDKKIDLSVLAQLPPIYEQPPLINQEGLLELQGHFDTPDFRVSFHLYYAYELPKWKLFGLNLGLTK